jgi:hypothetical protein
MIVNRDEIPSGIFHNEAEILKGILGQSFFTSVISEGSLKKSVMILTDKRLYQKGRIYEKNQYGKLVKSIGNKTINVCDITGTSFHTFNNVLQKIMGIICIVIGVFGLFLELNRTSEYGSMIAFLLLIFGVFNLIAYFATKQKYFLVEYAGGSIATSCNWYSMNEIEDFQKLLSIVKDESKNENKMTSTNQY